MTVTVSVEVHIVKRAMFSLYSPVLLNINDLHPVKPRESIHNLKLPHGHKKIVQALVQSHFDRAGSKWRANSGDDEPDLIHGKGTYHSR